MAHNGERIGFVTSYAIDGNRFIIGLSLRGFCVCEGRHADFDLSRRGEGGVEVCEVVERKRIASGE